MIDYTAIGHRIRQARHAAHMTQEKLAEQIDRSVQFVGHIERGTRKLSVETLVRLCEALHVSTDIILKP